MNARVLRVSVRQLFIFHLELTMKGDLTKLKEWSEKWLTTYNPIETALS